MTDDEVPNLDLGAVIDEKDLVAGGKYGKRPTRPNCSSSRDSGDRVKSMARS